MERWEKVTHISIGFAWTVAALFGIAGYSTFRALSQGRPRLIVNFPLSILIAFPQTQSAFLIIFRVSRTLPPYFYLLLPPLLQGICWRTTAGMMT